jgi:hypothetical protein
MQSHPDKIDELKIYPQVKNILNEVFAYCRKLEDYLSKHRTKTTD